LIRYTVRAEVDHGHGRAEVLRRLNRLMLHDTGDAPARFATVALGQLSVDANGADLTVANAGHPAPLVRRRAGVERLSAPGTLLGVYPDIELTETTVRLDRGDIMVLYTDGVTEAHGVNGYYGEQRLRDVVGSSAATSAEVVADDLLTDVVAFQQGRLRDDVAVLVLQVTP
jgi:serine phosphatase RsbU (regulator of sigma subunit)